MESFGVDCAPTPFFLGSGGTFSTAGFMGSIPKGSRLFSPSPSRESQHGGGDARMGGNGSGGGESLFSFVLRGGGWKRPSPS